MKWRVFAVAAVCMMALAACTPPAGNEDPNVVAKAYLDAASDDEGVVLRTLSVEATFPHVISWKKAGAAHVRKETASLDAFREAYLKQRDLAKEIKALAAREEFIGKDFEMQTLKDRWTGTRRPFALLMDLSDSGRAAKFYDGRRFSELTGTYSLEIADFPFDGELRVFSKDKTLSGRFTVRLARMRMPKGDEPRWKVFDLVDEKGRSVLIDWDRFMPQGFDSVQDLLDETKK